MGYCPDMDRARAIVKGNRVVHRYNTALGTGTVIALDCRGNPPRPGAVVRFNGGQPATPFCWLDDLRRADHHD